jgi:hypothetical protein
MAACAISQGDRCFGINGEKHPNALTNIGVVICVVVGYIQ